MYCIIVFITKMNIRVKASALSAYNVAVIICFHLHQRVGAVFFILGTNVFVQKQMHHSVTLSASLCVCGLVKAAVVLPLDQPKPYRHTLSPTHTQIVSRETADLLPRQPSPSGVHLSVCPCYFFFPLPFLLFHPSPSLAESPSTSLLFPLLFFFYFLHL